MKIGTGKTKKVSGVDLSSSCFAFVGDIENPNTWKVAVCFPGNPEKARASVLDALAKFEKMRSTWISDAIVQRVFDTLRGAALAHGISLEREVFEQQIAPPPITEPDADVPSEKELRRRNRRQKELEAMADFAADEMLAALGID